MNSANDTNLKFKPGIYPYMMWQQGAAKLEGAPYNGLSGTETYLFLSMLASTVLSKTTSANALKVSPVTKG